MKRHVLKNALLIFVAGLAMSLLMPSAFAVAQEGAGEGAAAVQETMENSSADAAASASGTEKIDLVVIRPFTSKSSKRYSVGKDVRVLKGMLATYCGQRYARDPRINTWIAMSTPVEEDVIENRLFRKDNNYKDMKDILNTGEVKKFASENNAHLVLLSDIEVMNDRIENKQVGFGEHAYYKANGYFDVTMHFSLYDSETDSFLLSKPYSVTIFTGSMSWNGGYDDYMRKYQGTTAAAVSRWMVKGDNSFTKDINDFMTSQTGGPFRAVYEQLFVELSPTVFKELKLEPIEEKGPKRSMLVVSAPTGYDVRAIRYDKTLNDFDSLLIAGQVSSSDVKLSKDGVHITAGDFDGDGSDELVTSTGYDMLDHKELGNYKKYQASLITVYRYKDGKFDMQNPVASMTNGIDEKKSGAYVAAGDFDGDGIDELAVSQIMWYDKVKIYKFRNGAFDVANPVAVVSKVFNAADGYDYGVYPAAVDLDGDGRDELAIAKVYKNDHIKVFRIGDGGAFTEIVDAKDMFGEYAGGVHITGGDFDGCGKEELVISAVTKPDVRVYSLWADTLDMSQPTATLGYTDEKQQNGYFVTDGDVDGDGKAELIVSKITCNNEVRAFRLAGSVFDTQAGSVIGNYANYPYGLYVTSGRF